ncbi:MAG: mechanosensitive ion channel [Lachnospiraceae bacterium]|nr:mechanosensitive ion channel [Lachnospiraceae bacterium]
MFQTYLKDFTDFGLDILLALVIFYIGRKLIKVLTKLIQKSFAKANADVSVAKFITSLSKYAMYAILVMIIASQVGINTTSFITVVGSASVAIGLAVQGSLSNFAGGVLILILKPFSVGDYIVGCSVEGVVEVIDLFYTVLVTGDNKKVHVPNGSLANSTIINVTEQKERRLDLVVGIGYQSDLKKAKQVMEEILSKREKVLLDRGVTVFVNNLGESSVEIGARAWVASGDYWTEKWAILEEIKERFDAEGIEIPFNQLDVHLDSGK